MNIIAAVSISALVLIAVLYCFNVFVLQRVTKAQRYAVTLRNNEGAFIALCTEKRWDRWVFEDVRITPSNPGGAVVQAAPGKLYVPKSNILYYQEMANVAE